ncbi:Cytochrome P450 71D8 [Hibiscus syriacus]|uniref:Cytochrome P450 71D8 n=1 Tax=Hibiscus syriacus TaxID=106335 RepID=A0A6A3CWB3_HIBSY|nr:Cytochrome P450 71D8 [Hibiscus syriacus]
MRTKLERLHHELDVMLERIIEEHRGRIANPKDSDDVADDLVDVLLNLQDHGDLKFPLTNDNIKAVILDLLMAATDTTSTTVEWAMSEMMKNPRILEKAQVEVRRVYDGASDVNESKLHELNYLKCEINGYEIPAKTKVIVNAWAIGRDSNYWNEADRFDPGRFIDSSVDYKGLNFEYIPFGSGRRICTGMSYGMAVVELTLAKLLYHFDWKLPNGMKTEDLDMAETWCFY